MISAVINPPTRPISTAGPTTVASPVERYWDQGQSALASSTTSSRNDLLIVPCRVIRSSRAAGRDRPEKTLSLKTGLPDRETGRGMSFSSAMPLLYAIRRGGRLLDCRVLLAASATDQLL